MAAPSLRRETAQLVDLAASDLSALWRLIEQGAAAEVALRDLLPAIITTYGQVGAALAAEWYDDLRVKAGVAGTFTAIPVEADDKGAHALIGWALTEANDDTTLRTLILGGVQRRIANHVRETVMGSAVADPGADGWQRVTDGKACGFCTMLADRGTVWRTGESASFASHDGCGCAAVVAWSGEVRPVKPYTQSTRNITDVDRKRARDWMRDNGYA